MSSLMQFNGHLCPTKGVQLQFHLERKVQKPLGGCGSTYTVTEDVDIYKCAECGREHARIGVAWRKPLGMLGCWVVFRYLGEEQVPDLSHPIGVPEWPRGTKILSDEESSAIWHS